jgi:hypothetical protein
MHNCLGRHFARRFLGEAVDRMKGYRFAWEAPPPPCVPLITMVPTERIAVTVTR